MLSQKTILLIIVLVLVVMIAKEFYSPVTESDLYGKWQVEKTVQGNEEIFSGSGTWVVFEFQSNHILNIYGPGIKIIGSGPIPYFEWSLKGKKLFLKLKDPSTGNVVQEETGVIESLNKKKMVLFLTLKEDKVRFYLSKIE